MRVIPAPGRQVRSPETKLLLPADGIDVPDDSILWNRILRDGDVIKATPGATVSTKTAKASETLAAPTTGGDK